MFRITTLLIIFIVSNFTAPFGNAQNKPRLCICFKENTKYISMDMRKDSTVTSFSIVRKGYETEEQREKERIRWEEIKSRIPIPPQFEYNFYSTKKPQKINSISTIDECVRIVTVESYRKKDFKMPENASSDLFIFIKKLENGRYLKWEALKMAIE